ncbi:MAG: RNA polymerase sigma factor [Hyphomonadaceae bacterium JAD_PAG50586_4]|nr:MAG: RNA polymerase sigma factor [Hyphomonadaceae bacterium JAD_PAG50586_4]
MKTDSFAFRAELVSLLPRLRRFALALTGRQDSAEDLLHSAVERALRNWGGFESGRRLDSWMFKIIQNRWIDMRRAQKHTSFEALGDGDLPGEDGREIVEMRDEMRAVRAAFGALTEDQRVVLALIVLEDLSYAQAAETLGVPIGTIMSRLSRARAALSTAMQRSVVVPMRRGK